MKSRPFPGRPGWGIGDGDWGGAGGLRATMTSFKQTWWSTCTSKHRALFRRSMPIQRSADKHLSAFNLISPQVLHFSAGVLSTQKHTNWQFWELEVVFSSNTFINIYIYIYSKRRHESRIPESERVERGAEPRRPQRPVGPQAQGRQGRRGRHSARNHQGKSESTALDTVGTWTGRRILGETGHSLPL